LLTRIGDRQRLLFSEAFADPCGQSFKDKEHALSVARGADLIVLVVSEDCTVSGEGVSRADLTLSGVQQELLDALTKIGKPIALTADESRQRQLEALPPVDMERAWNFFKSRVEKSQTGPD